VVSGAAVVKCPLTHDYGFFRMALEDVSTDSVSRGGTLIGDAIRTVIEQVFDNQSKAHRDVVLITDGEDHESYPVEAAKKLGEMNVRLIAIGLYAGQLNDPDQIWGFMTKHLLGTGFIGIMMVGVQGGGKSLAAKAVAGLWGLPLLRMDMGAIYNKFFGESERNVREALELAETMSPCVLWIDEIEKGIAVGDNDGGTSRRVLGTLLTWMAENQASLSCSCSRCNSSAALVNAAHASSIV